MTRAEPDHIIDELLAAGLDEDEIEEVLRIRAAQQRLATASPTRQELDDGGPI